MKHKTLDHKYEMLVKILDKLRQEAPISYKTYHPADDESAALQKARSLS
jgi:hypothetical protein